MAKATLASQREARKRAAPERLMMERGASSAKKARSTKPPRRAQPRPVHRRITMRKFEPYLIAMAAVEHLLRNGEVHCMHALDAWRMRRDHVLCHHGACE